MVTVWIALLTITLVQPYGLPGQVPPVIRESAVLAATEADCRAEVKRQEEASRIILVNYLAQGVYWQTVETVAGGPCEEKAITIH